MLHFEIEFTEKALEQYEFLKSNTGLKKRCKAVQKTLGYLQTNPRHPSLNTHKYSAMQGENGEEIFEAYAENNTPGAYRIFWCYGQNRNQITIIAITPHP